jgi:hypothetical protein
MEHRVGARTGSVEYFAERMCALLVWFGAQERREGKAIDLSTDPFVESARG